MKWTINKWFPSTNSSVMSRQQSYFSRPYAAAWGTLIGTVTGIPIAIATDATVIPVLSLSGLLIGFVISQRDKAPSSEQALPRVTKNEKRLRELEELRARSLISREEYEAKRNEIISHL